MKQKGAQGAAGTETLLLAVVCVLIFVVMFAHMTAIKNIGIGLAALGLVCIGGFGKRSKPGKRSKSAANQKSTQTAALQVGWPGGGLLLPMALWALWSLLSIGWSVFSEASVAAWLDEVAYPVIGFFAFYRLAAIGCAPLPSPTAQQLSRPAQDAPVAGESRYAVYVECAAWAATLVLAVLSAMQFFGATSPVGSAAAGTTSALATSPAASAPATSLDVLHFLGAPVEVGTLALIVIPFFVALCARTTAMSGAGLLMGRLLGLSGVALAVAAGFMLSSLTFPVCAALTVLIAVAPAWRHRVWLGGVSAALLLALALLVTPYMQGARGSGVLAAQRAVSLVPSAASSAVPASAASASQGLVADWLGAWQNIMTSDVHPAIWRFFAEQGLAHPWMGIGFGKPLAAYAYGADAWSAQWPHWAQSSVESPGSPGESPSVVSPDTGAASQPSELRGLAADAPPAQVHDMLLNTWLQLGVVGVVLQIWLWFALLRAYVRSGPANGWLKASGLALVVGVFCHNLFDDVLLQSTVLAFWAHAGWTLGRARLSGLVAGRRISGRAVAMRRLRRVGN